MISVDPEITEKVHNHFAATTTATTTATTCRAQLFCQERKRQHPTNTLVASLIQSLVPLLEDSIFWISLFFHNFVNPPLCGMCQSSVSQLACEDGSNPDGTFGFGIIQGLFVFSSTPPSFQLSGIAFEFWKWGLLPRPNRCLG